MKIIEVSGIVADALRGDKSLSEIIGDRLFPVVAKDGVDGYPFVTYRNLGLSDSDNKDAFGCLKGKVEIEVAAETFESAATTSGEIRRVLEGYDGSLEFEMSNYEEEFDADLFVFVSVITFNYDED